MKLKTFDLIVVGGGASGLMAAITAAGKNAGRIAVLDHSPVPAKKILSTGNGKCNFTNRKQGSDCYHSDDPAFVMHIINQFSPEDLIDFFRRAGVPHKERQGYCYPRNGQASVIRTRLLQLAEEMGILILNDVGIRSITPITSGFKLDTRQGDFFCKACILASGGKAAPKTGSDGSGFVYAKQLGHTVTELYPALMPLYCGDHWPKALKGVRADGKVELLVDGQVTARDVGELQFTDYGLSGIPVFQISGAAAQALGEGRGVSLSVDLLPEFTYEELEEYLEEIFRQTSCDTKTLLSGMLHEKLADYIAGRTRKNKNDCQSLATLIKGLKFPVTATKGYDMAQVTRGGIPLGELQSGTMESRLIPGLYFCGEMTNVDGICGGYNLQWAFSSGYAAGKAALNSLQR